MEPPAVADERPRRAFYAARTDRPAVFRFERLDPPKYRVMEQFDYVDRLGHVYRVPVDVESNETDLASVPPFLTWLVPRDGTHTPAAVLHDALIGGRSGVDYESGTGRDVPDRHADYLFREAMQATGVSWLRRWLMWAAVALRTLSVSFSEKDGRREERKRWGRILPIGVAVGIWGLVAATMALDVPDLLADRLPAPFDWAVVIGDRPALDEIALALALIVGGSVVMSVVFGIVLGFGQGGDAVERAALAGLISGLTLGFLALPMLASLVGAAGYLALEWISQRLRS